MRGTRCPRPESRATTRIIPADAGNTFSDDLRNVQYKDHPRGCGEHRPKIVRDCNSVGSSPRMRGTLHWRVSNFTSPGIIPADAGNTIPNIVRKDDTRDHPRGCGEHHDRLNREYASRGSSPRMRGTQGITAISVGLAWIIPADAGNTGLSFLAITIAWDHPRGCGEHTI